MDKYGLIGYPLKHSFSISYFNEKFQSENIDAEYVNFEIPRIEDFMEVVEENPNLRGLNVTIPYKEQVIPYLDELDKDTAKIGAVNVIKIIPQGKGDVKLVGYNSDIIGFTRSIEQRPFDVPFKEDGSYMIGGVDVPRHNGIQVLNEQESKNEWYRVLANAYLSIKPFEGLEYKLSLSGDVRYSNDYLKLTKNHPYGSPKGEISDYRSLSQNYLLDNTLTYTKSIHNLNLTALGGYSMQEMSDNSSSIVGKDFPSPNFD